MSRTCGALVMDEQEDTFVASLDEALAFMRREAVNGVRVHPPREAPGMTALPGNPAPSSGELTGRQHP